MSTLYLTDLDGTLLRPDATLSPDDARRINRLTAAGVRISFATARTVRSAAPILSAVDFTHPGCAPVALMNGTMLRDMARGVYVAVERFSQEAARAVLASLTAFGEPFVYVCDPDAPVLGDPLTTWYRDLANDAMRRFRDERVSRWGKPFFRFRSADELPGATVYFCQLGSEDPIRRADEALDGIPGIRRTAYPDAYEPGLWYLEVFPETASKRRAVEFLRAYTGCARVVAFGDNRNDLAMFEAADLAVAVTNAADEVRAMADAVTENVVAWIERDAGAEQSNL
ncbi:MAG: HAD hydrolase family protein [Clostridia bacterium]|nr:HAD hydrolase family protein [Clostridia bacterium]